MPFAASLYRGVADEGQGLGYGPGSPPVRGVQYLRADAELLARPHIFEAAKLWLTLDTNETDSEQGIEGWSYFPVGDLRFVARLIPAPKFGDRLGFFSHARVFRKSDMEGAWDPGVLLGQSEGFDALSGLDSSKRVPLPEIDARCFESLAEDQAGLDAAKSILAHLYDAIVKQRAVVVAAEMPEFASGGRLAKWISFVRAALPVPLKLDLRLRFFTRNAGLYLSQLNTQLLVVPKEDVRQSVHWGENLTILDSRGRRLQGPEPDINLQHYADVLTKRFRDYPEALLHFSPRYIRLGKVDRPPEEGQLQAMALAYNLAAMSGRGKNGVEWLMQTAGKRELGVSPTHLLLPEEFDGLDVESLIRLIFWPRSGNAAQETIRNLCAAQLAQSGQPRDELVLKILQPLSAAGLPMLAMADRQQLFRASNIQDLLAALKLNDFEGLAEEDAGTLSRHIRWSDRVTSSTLEEWSSVLRQPSLLKSFLESGLTNKDVGAFDWTPVMEKARPSDLSHLFGYLLDNKFFRYPSRDQNLLWLTGRLVECSPLPESVVARCAAMKAADVVRERPDIRLYLTELRCAAGTPPEDVIRRSFTDGPVLQGFTIQQREIYLAGALRKSGWKSLDQRWIIDNRRFIVPESWLPDTVELLLGDSGLIQQLSLESFAGLLQKFGQKETISNVIYAEMDRRVSAADSQIVSDLLAARLWGNWRVRTQLPDNRLREVALEWLHSKHWANWQWSAPIEQWDQVIQDLDNRIEATEISTYPSCGELFAEKQFRDLARLADGDSLKLAYLASLAERQAGGSRRSFKTIALEYAPPGFTTTLLSVLANPNAPDLVLEQEIDLLALNLGPGHSIVQNLVVEFVRAHIVKSPEIAIPVADKYGYWSKQHASVLETALDVVVSAACENRLMPEAADLIGKELLRLGPPLGSPRSEAQQKRFDLAASLLLHSARELAGVLSPSIVEDRSIAEQMPAVARAVVAGWREDSEWLQFRSRIERALTMSEAVALLKQLRDELRNAKYEDSSDERPGNERPNESIEMILALIPILKIDAIKAEDARVVFGLLLEVAQPDLLSQTVLECWSRYPNLRRYTQWVAAIQDYHNIWPNSVEPDWTFSAIAGALEAEENAGLTDFLSACQSSTKSDDPTEFEFMDNITICVPPGNGKICWFPLNNGGRVAYWTWPKDSSEKACNDAFSKSGGLRLAVDEKGIVTWSFSKIEPLVSYLDLGPQGDIEIKRISREQERPTVTPEKGHYLFFPATPAMAEKLEQLKFALEAFPGDMRRSLQAFLRNPMMEFRISALERNRPSETTAGSQSNLIWGRILPAVTLALVLAALVMIALPKSKERSSEKPNSGAEIQSSSQDSSKEGSSEKVLAPKITKELVNLGEKIQSSSLPSSIRTRFGNINLGAPDTEKLENALVVLIANHVKPQQAYDQADSDAIAVLPKALESESAVQETLRVVGCTTRQKPQVEAGQLIYRPYGDKCEGVDDDLAVRGIQRLETWVPSRPK